MGVGCDKLRGCFGETAVKQVQGHQVHGVFVTCRTTQFTPRAVSGYRLLRLETLHDQRKCPLHKTLCGPGMFSHTWPLVYDDAHTVFTQPCSTIINQPDGHSTVLKPHSEALHICSFGDNKQSARPILLHLTRNAIAYNSVARRCSKLILKCEPIDRNITRYLPTEECKILAV